MHPGYTSSINKDRKLHVKSSMPCEYVHVQSRPVCSHTPKGSVVNFTAYQNFIELIQIILKYIEVLSLWSLSGFRYNF